MITARLHRKRDSAEYQRVHKWVYLNFGKADHCENDPTHTSGRFHWANLSGQYRMEADDWKQLCPTCHKQMDGISEEVREIKRQQAYGNTSHCKPVLMVYPHGSWIKFTSSRVASEATGIIATAISNALRGDAKTAGGYQWRRIAS